MGSLFTLHIYMVYTQKLIFECVCVCFFQSAGAGEFAVAGSQVEKYQRDFRYANILNTTFKCPFIYFRLNQAPSRTGKVALILSHLVAAAGLVPAHRTVIVPASGNPHTSSLQNISTKIPLVPKTQKMMVCLDSSYKIIRHS